MNPTSFASIAFFTFALALLPACAAPEIDCAGVTVSSGATVSAQNSSTIPVVPAAVVTRPVPVVSAAVVTRAVTDPAVFTQDVTISSDPFGATVSIDGKAVGVTPIVATLDLSRTYDVTIAKSGYEPANFTIKGVSNAVGGSSVKSGGIGVGGSFTKFPSSYNATLKLGAADPLPALEAAIADLDKQRASGQITPAQYTQRLDELKKQYTQK